jgi:hypothetical protein
MESIFNIRAITMLICYSKPWLLSFVALNYGREKETGS